MSEVKVNKVSPRSGTGLQLGDSGDTITIPSGATIDNQGTATNFGATGSASWTTTVKTGDFTAVAGEGYFVDTSSTTITATLPSSPSAGDVVAFKDYANTFDTSTFTINRNGSPIGGDANNKILTTEGIAVTLIYIDGTKGWLVTDDGVQSSLQGITYSSDMLVVAGGGSGGGDGGGGGAGGFRTSTQTLNQGIVYTITVGAGASAPPSQQRNDGSDSSISGSGLTTITSAGGGGGGYGSSASSLNGHDGGSGGGGGSGPSGTSTGAGGTGNTPSTTPSQGNNGGTGQSDNANYRAGGGGGGAGAVGQNSGTGGNNDHGGDGGDGTASSITGSSVTYAGGGGGRGGTSAGGGNGGAGGGGAGGYNGGSSSGVAGTANTGGGGGSNQNSSSGVAGGSGVVILSVPDASYSGTTTGSPTVATGVSGKTVMTFTGNGSYTA